MAARMHADELAVDATLARRLVAAQFPAWADRPLAPVPSPGTDNVLFRLGDDLVLRFPRRPVTEQALRKELRWLPRLAGSLSVAIPVPVAEGDPSPEYPWTWAVYPWLAGSDATADGAADVARLAEDLGAVVRALHSLDSADGPRPGAHNADRGLPLAPRDRSVQAALAALDGAIDVGAAAAAWEEALDAPDWDGMPVWIHGDLDRRNLLVQGGRLAAVIDWGCLGVGDPACDAMAAWKLFEGDARERFRAALALDRATWIRARGWVVSQALQALAYYTTETNPPLVREAGRWLDEALSDDAAPPR